MYEYFACIQVHQQPKDNGTDCGIYLLRSMEIVLDTIAEGVALGQSSEYIVSVNFFQGYKLRCLSLF
jgi:hypothetical protein